MPAPRSRRGPAARPGAKPPVATPAKPPETPPPAPAEDAPVDIVDVELPAPSEADAQAPQVAEAEATQSDAAPESAASSRRGRASARASSKGKAVSEKKPKVRVELTPEQIAERRARIKLVLTICGAVSLFVLGLVCLFVFGLRDSKEVKETREHLQAIEGVFQQIKNARSSRDPARMRELIETANTLFADSKSKWINYGDGYNPQGENHLKPEWNERAKTIKDSLAGFEDERERLDKEIKVQRSTDALRKQMETLELPDTDLDKLEAAINAYIANPINPEAGSGPDVSAWSNNIDHAKTYLKRIENQRAVRSRNEIDKPKALLEADVSVHITNRTYGKALEHIAQVRTSTPKITDACTEAEARVNAAAKQAWESVERDIKTRTDEIAGVATPPSRAKVLREEIRGICTQVIDLFGIEEYVGKARTIRDQHPE